MTDPDLECRMFHSLPNVTDVCDFVRNTDDCGVDEGFVNYNAFVYCTMHGVIPGATVILILLWLFVFCGMALTTNDFFCPTLSAISQSLHLSHNVAGVTFLAVGNGAADIFSSIAAINNAKAGDAGLAIGALFGAAIVMTAVLVGTIVIVCPFKSVERPFLRDVIFSLIATYWTWFVLWDKKMMQYEALGFIILYLVYVAVVVIGRYIHQRSKRSRASRMVNVVGGVSVSTDDDDLLLLSHEVAPSSPGGDDDNILYDIQSGLEDEETPDPNLLLPSFLHAVSPISRTEWRRAGPLGKVYQCVKAPIRLILLLTIPLVHEKRESSMDEMDEVEEEEDLRNWNKPLNCLHMVTGPVCAIFLTPLAFIKLGGVFPVWALVLTIGLCLAVLVFATSRKDRRPVYHMAFAYISFLVTVVWIYSLANEIVNMLQTVGIMFNLSNAILGLTLLAWGNAIGDFVADFTMARRGFPQIGVSACFGGPLFNILLGLGIPFTVACFRKGGEFKLQVNMEQMVLAAGMGVSLVASLIIVPLCGFYMRRSYGIFLLCLYAAFLLVAILTEVDVIPNTDL